MKVLILVFAIVFGLLNSTAAAAAISKTHTNQEAEDFTLEDLDAKSWNLNELKSKVVLFFWATWCPHCRSKIPKLNKAYPDMKKDGVEVLAIDIGESKERVKSFLEKNAVDFPILFDRDSKVSGQYNVLGVPTFVFIDENKKVVFTDYDLPDDYLGVFSK